MKKRVLLCLLLAVLILPTAFTLPPAAVAEEEQGQGTEAEPVVGPPPNVVGIYAGRGTATIIWRYRYKERLSLDCILVVLCQNGTPVCVWWWAVPTLPDSARAKAWNIEPPEKAPGSAGWVWPVGGNPNGWVGRMILDPTSGKPKNKPPLTAAWFYIYDPASGGYFASHLMAVVKLDKYQNVKSIKGTASESDWWYGYHATVKFTVTPYSGGGLPPGMELPPGIKLPPGMELPQKSE